MGIFMSMMFGFLLFSSVNLFSQCGQVDHGGANMIINTNTMLGGEHINVNKFQVINGVTLTVDPACKFLIVHADTIIVAGIINGNNAGSIGGNGGAGGGAANGSGNSGKGGFGGQAGTGNGGGLVGANGGAGGTITQICGGLFCAGNRDGMNGGGGGGGAGSGGAYGGTSGIGGWGAFGTGFTGASGGSYGASGVSASAYGTVDGIDITWGSGGGGAGGGGGGWTAGMAGGKGGNGGAMVRLTSNGPLTVVGSIWCNGENGQYGGNGAGESTDNGFDCSCSGYSACGLCSESIYDGAGGAGGGAGGGSGGGILLQANGPMNVTGTLQAKGGDGGIAGIPTSNMGTCFDDSRGGGSGSGGRIKIFSNPCYNHNIAPNASVVAGAGGSGVTVGLLASAGTYRGDLVNPSYTVLVAGAIQLDDPDFCMYGDVPEITSTTPASGGVPGILTYQWQYSIVDAVSGFSNIPGQISLTYNPNIISQTTWYRRKAVSGTCEEFSNVVKVTVTPAPTVVLSGLSPQYCSTDGPVTMTGTPSGGTFSGGGVTNDQFHPTVAGIGMHTIKYTYVEGGCTINDQKNVHVVDCTSIEEIENVSATVYPNPSTGEFYIELIGFNGSDVLMKMYNLNGQMVFEKYTGQYINGQKISISVKIPSGNYMLHIISGERTLTEPISIQ